MARISVTDTNKFTIQYKYNTHLGIGGHGDRSAKLFGGQKLCYGSQ